MNLINLFLKKLKQYFRRFHIKLTKLLIPSLERNEADINYLWVSRRFSIDYFELSNKNYKRFSHIPEAEHQIGRLINLEKVVKTIREENIPGDFVEFGTFQGLFLIWLARFRNKYGLNHKKIIGIDSFEGLPINSNSWEKGQFGNTDKSFVLKNLKNYLNSEELFNVELIQGWFSDKNVMNSLYKKTQEIALIHFDADLKFSTDQAFEIVDPYLYSGNAQFLLFDDWGCHPKEVPQSFYNWKLKHQNISCNEISSTKLTKYFKIKMIDKENI